MAKTVFILGAGASKESGAPLMMEFLDCARNLVVGTKLNNVDKNEFETVFKALVELRGVFFKSGLDLDNIESVFSAFEMARLIQKLGNYNNKEIEILEHAIKKVIVRTLEESILFHISPNKIADPSYTYLGLVSLLREIEKDSSQTWSLMTFNYDIALDYVFHHLGCHVNYFLDNDIKQDGKPFLKLHGSLGWGYCQKCGAVEMLPVGPLKAIDPEISGWKLPYQITERFNKLNHIENPCDGQFEPMIVPPSWNKGQHQEKIKKVWRQAASELGEAENIIVMGYSLPDTDLFFRYLYALGAVGNAHIRRFWVFNPEDKGVVDGRFRNMIGKGIENRYAYFPFTFSCGINFMRVEKKFWNKE